MTTAHSRLAARLAALPPDALLALAALGCEQSEAVRAAVHSPFPEWAVEAVLLSSDLLPHFLGWFELEQHTVKGVCKAWRGAWAATLEGRRALRPGPELVAPWDYFCLLAWRDAGWGAAGDLARRRASLLRPPDGEQGDAAG